MAGSVGGGAVTLRDVAKLAGVNIATASRALSDDRRDLVSQETARKVVDAARKLGYRPNPIARGLKTNRSFTIGVLIPDLTNPLYPPMVRGIDDVLGAVGYTPLVANTENDIQHERTSFDALRARRVDGFLMATALREHPLSDEAVAAEIPLVLVLRTTEARSAPAVCVDEGAGVADAMTHLVELGHRTVGHVAGPQSMSPAHERQLAFLASVEKHRLADADDLVVVGESFSIEEGRRACAKLLARAEHPSAILAGNDLMALGCLDAIAEAGLRCPEDVSIVGYNDMPFADRFSPPLTSVRIPQYDLGARGAQVLLDRLGADGGGQGEPAPPELLPPTLIVRGSTAPPPRPL